MLNLSSWHADASGRKVRASFPGCPDCNSGAVFSDLMHRLVSKNLRCGLFASDADRWQPCRLWFSLCGQKEEFAVLAMLPQSTSRKMAGQIASMDTWASWPSRRQTSSALLHCTIAVWPLLVHRSSLILGLRFWLRNEDAYQPLAYQEHCWTSYR